MTLDQLTYTCLFIGIVFILAVVCRKYLQATTTVRISTIPLSAIIGIEVLGVATESRVWVLTLSNGDWPRFITASCPPSRGSFKLEAANPYKKDVPCTNLYLLQPDFTYAEFKAYKLLLGNK